MDAIWNMIGTAIVVGIVAYQFGYSRALNHAGQNWRKERDRILANPKSELSAMYALQARERAAGATAHAAWWSTSSTSWGDGPRHKASKAAEIAFMRSAEADAVSQEAMRRAEQHWRDLQPVGVHPEVDVDEPDTEGEENEVVSRKQDSIWSSNTRGH